MTVTAVVDLDNLAAPATFEVGASDNAADRRDAFDIRDFHDLVLKDGPVPLSILEQKVDAMISAAQAG